MTPQEREKWLAQRKLGLGGSDIAAIFNKSPWTTPYGLWLDKKGLVPPKEETPAMMFGSAMEDAIAQMYFNKEGRRLRKIKESMAHPDPRFSHCRATPDYLDDANLDAPILSVKFAPYSREKWGEEGSDAIPDYYLLQSIWEMEVCDRENTDVAVSFGKPEAHYYYVARRREFGAYLLKTAEEWWRKHIVEGVEPPVDASQEATDYLTKLYSHPKKEVKKADAGVGAVMVELASISDSVQLLKKRSDAIKNELRAFMGDFEILEGDGYRAVWSMVRGRRTVYYEGVVEQILEKHPELKEDITAFKKTNIQMGDFGRRFQLKTIKEGINHG